MLRSAANAVKKVQRRMTSSSEYTNRLAQEKSPYLLQHKHNPIEWYPWGQEAFDKAMLLNRPIFLSVGYSTCHWCHVMERESFESQQIAAILNENFVSIKVDREERPDVDQLYMSFVVAISGHGGWPMSVWLTPQREPFMGGTYFPREQFARLLAMIADKWRSSPEELQAQGKMLLDAIEKSGRSARSEAPPVDVVARGAFEHKSSTYDATHGGFGSKPKFPKAVDLDFLLAFSAWQEKDSRESEMAETMLSHTLDGMWRGGLRDHVGKGFHRYSVDSEWHVPHFEKMLYDQAQLMATYADHARKSDAASSRAAVQDIWDYVKDNLSHPAGGFYSAEDADSHPTEGAAEKREGAFCVWTHEEMQEVLAGKKIGERDMMEVISDYFDVREEGNVPPTIDPHGELCDQNVLRMRSPGREVAERMGVTEEELERGVEEAKVLLSARRSLRPRPHLDSKMVTAWQGLMISGLAKGAAALGDDSLLTRALECVSFVRSHLMTEEGDLLRAAYRGEDGTVQHVCEPIRAFADDYAFLIQGLLDLHEYTMDEQWIELADRLQTRMDVLLWDDEGQSGYYTSEREGSVRVRSIQDQDGAEPAATSCALSNLVRLADVLDCGERRERAERILEAAGQRLLKFPYILTKMIPAYKRLEDGSKQVVVVGPSSSPLLHSLLSEVRSHWVWNKTAVWLDTDKKDSLLCSRVPHYASLLSAPSPAVYICEGKTCGLPAKTVQEVRQRMAE